MGDDHGCVDENLPLWDSETVRHHVRILASVDKYSGSTNTIRIGTSSVVLQLLILTQVHPGRVHIPARSYSLLSRAHE
jgi:hypothetical protein